MGASKSTMDAQGNQGISRRGFLRGVGLAGLAAGGLCTATAVAAATGSADAAYAEESAATVGNELIEIYGENVNLMPAYGAEWDEQGPQYVGERGRLRKPHAGRDGQRR